MLHVLICRYPGDSDTTVGIGGVFLIVGDINDLYSGWRTAAHNQMWRMRCYEKIANDKDVYLTILRRFINFNTDNDAWKALKSLLVSSASKYSTWDNQNNAAIYAEIFEIVKETYPNIALYK